MTGTVLVDSVHHLVWVQALKDIVECMWDIMSNVNYLASVHVYSHANLPGKPGPHAESELHILQGHVRLNVLINTMTPRHELSYCRNSCR